MDVLTMNDPGFSPVSPLAPSTTMVDDPHLRRHGQLPSLVRADRPSSPSHEWSVSVVGITGKELPDIGLPPLGPRRSESPLQDRRYIAERELRRRKREDRGRNSTRLRTGMTSSIRRNTPDEPNPEPVPFQPQNFMSSTKLKKVHISKRHHDTFGGVEYSIPSKRGIILHSDRYNWEGAKPLEGTISQRDRMRLEIDYVEKLRGLKKRKEVPLHRTELDLLMAGKKIEFDERFDLKQELQHLKSLALPDAAKDLFHGKGIRLPESHASIKPRQTDRLDLTYDAYNEDVSASAPGALRTLPPGFAIDPDIRRGRSPFDGHISSPTGNFSGLTGPLPSIGGDKRSPNFQLGRKRAQLVAAVLPQSMPSALPKLEPQTVRSYSGSVRSDKHKKQLEPAPPPPRKEKSPIYQEQESLLQKRRERQSESGSEMDMDVMASQFRLSPSKNAATNPLKGTNIDGLVSEGERTALTQTFQRLDTDMDGHLQYHQLQSQLSATSHQERFLKEVYDMITQSSQSFFGVDEFMTMNLLSKAVNGLSGPAKDAFENMDFETLGESILHFVELFQSVDRVRKGHISIDSLREILSTSLEKDFNTQPQTWMEILQTLNPESGSSISKLEYMSLIPYFTSLHSPQTSAD